MPKRELAKWGYLKPVRVVDDIVLDTKVGIEAIIRSHDANLGIDASGDLGALNTKCGVSEVLVDVIYVQAIAAKVSVRSGTAASAATQAPRRSRRLGSVPRTGCCQGLS